MTINTSTLYPNIYQGFGLVGIPHLDVRPPNFTDVLYPIGKQWVWKGNASYILLSLSSIGGVTTANWVQTSGVSNFTTQGSITSTAGDITASNGNLNLGTAGNKLNIATGTNSSTGVTSAMVAGAVTVATTACTASSIILYSRKTTGGTAGQVSITAQSSGSFTLTSSSNTETSTFNYLIIN